MKNEKEKSVFSVTVERIRKLHHMDISSQKAILAKLRHGIGLIPGEDPNLWGILFEELPKEMLGRYGKPSKEEWAIYNALTLYALHQQGNEMSTKDMNQKGISLGKAASMLVQSGDGSDGNRERISRRFNQIALADDIETLSYYLRTFIPMLRANKIPLDYPMLANDIFYYQFETSRHQIKLKWGQDFYSLSKEEIEDEK
ncbi:MAG: type I-E CRISPR-associated protein Cse2/CasB [Bacillota bacterium]|nr:type I-E CRISPR-associated protein Cse2/CasB [Bacillota bacterium]